MVCSISMSAPVQVFKFGGAAVGNADAIRVAAAHVKRTGTPLAIVVSAMNGVTDLLLGAAQAALHGDRDGAGEAAKAFEQRHLTLVDELFPKRGGKTLRAAVTESAHELRSMTDSIAVFQVGTASLSFGSKP